MTPELNTTLTAITQILMAHSVNYSNSNVLNDDEYEQLTQTLAHCPLATLTDVEWGVFYDGLPNSINIIPDYNNDAALIINNLLAITDKTTFFYEILINTSPHSHASFLPIVPKILTRLQTQNEAFDHGDEDDVNIIESVENILALLIPHATVHENLHHWYKQCIELLDISATVIDSVRVILCSLAYQILSLPNGRMSLETLLNQIKNRGAPLSENQSNALYRGYAIIALQDPTWGWHFFKHALEQSLPTNEYPPTQVTQLQTLFSLVPFLSPAEHWQYWNQIFTQLQKSTVTRAHGPLCKLLVRLLIRILPYLSLENIPIVNAQARAVMENTNEIASIKTLMKLLLAYIVPSEEQSQKLDNNQNTTNDDASFISFAEHSEQSVELNFANPRALSDFFYTQLEDWRDIGKMIEENMADSSDDDQEEHVISISHAIQQSLLRWSQLFPQLNATYKRYFWHAVRIFLFSGFNNSEMAGRIRTTVACSLYCLAPQLLADSNKHTLQENIALFHSTLHAALLCLLHPPENEAFIIPHIMSEETHTHLVSSTFNALAAAVPYIPTESQWNFFREELEPKASYRCIHHYPIFTFAMAAFSPAILSNSNLDSGLNCLNNVNNYQSFEQVKIMANDLIACIFWPRMYEDKAISDTVSYSLQRLVTHRNEAIQTIGLLVLNQWIEQVVKPLSVYQALVLKKGAMLPMDLIRMIAFDENIVAQRLFETENGINMKRYHDACKIFSLRLLLQLKARPMSPVLEKAIVCIEKCWKLSPNLLQISQTMYKANTSKKRAIEMNNNNSNNGNSRSEDSENKSQKVK